MSNEVTYAVHVYGDEKGQGQNKAMLSIGWKNLFDVVEQNRAIIADNFNRYISEELIKRGLTP